MNDDVYLYATAPGAAIYIGGYGTATDIEGVRVPRAVGDEFAGRADLRVDEVAAPAVETFSEAARDLEVTVSDEWPRVGRKEGK